MKNSCIFANGVATIDIGNTNTTIGYFKDDNLIETIKRKTKGISYKFLLKKKPKHIIVSSVVPRVSKIIKSLYPNAKLIKLEELPIKDCPKTIGLDRAINLHTAAKIYSDNVTVVDFGTAITISCLKDRHFAGGFIMPGIDIMQQGLSKTAQLPYVDVFFYSYKFKKLGFPFKTNEAMAKGMFYLICEGVQGIIKQIKKKLGDNQIIIATGGGSLLFGSEIEGIQVINPTLLLEGLNSFNVHFGLT